MVAHWLQVNRDGFGQPPSGSADGGTGLFVFDGQLYAFNNHGLFRLDSLVCRNWLQVFSPGESYFVIGAFLFCSGAGDLWFIAAKQKFTSSNWHKVSSTGSAGVIHVVPLTTSKGSVYGRHALACTHLQRPDGRSHALRSLEMFEGLGEWSQVGKAQNNLAIDSYFAGSWSEAIDHYRAGGEAAERAGDLVTVATCENNLGEIESDRGRYPEAKRLFESALATWTVPGYRVGVGVGVALARSNVGRLAVRSGDAVRGVGLLEEALGAFVDIGATALAYEAEVRLVEAWVARGDAEGALERIDRLAGEFDATDGTLERFRGHALAIAGDRDSAQEDFARAVSLLDDGATATSSVWRNVFWRSSLIPRRTRAPRSSPSWDRWTPMSRRSTARPRGTSTHRESRGPPDLQSPTSWRTASTFYLLRARRHGIVYSWLIPLIPK